MIPPSDLLPLWVAMTVLGVFFLGLSLRKTGLPGLPMHYVNVLACCHVFLLVHLPGVVESSYFSKPSLLHLDTPATSYMHPASLHSGQDLLICVVFCSG